MERTNIFLGGFMAAGKTSTGRELGLRMGRPFIDVDELIEEREGMSVAEIFRQRGEPYFRRVEAETILELCELEHMVIAMGGGALVNSRVKDRVLERGRLVILDVMPETVIKRARKEKGKRPLMDPRNIKELMEKRRGAYEGGDLKIGTDDKSVARVAGEIIRRFGLSPKGEDARKEPIVGGRVFVGRGNLGEKLEEIGRKFPRPPFVVSDNLVGPLYRDRLGETRGFFLLPRGEEAKSLFWVEKLYSAFAEAEVDRGDVIVALGGGCVGDAAGFASSTWMRGVPVIQCPTTLLSQVDSAIGGKVGVNLREGKNLAGAFHQPLAVISDVQCLLTLSREHYRQGLAEAVKYGLREDLELFPRLERNAKALLVRDEKVLPGMVSRL
ncbi:MAG TPA: 3-dehydroquinate synthase, partial [Synergistaceae bacterium]|nr:3-dehydroquinate synthase [Synergistaceae bacterium]